ncbi:peptidase family M20/M25/M40 protein [Arthroderma uncinatum]|uniref:peptidase family M20/M25/M40 protein n=1 Tax=Arthroderma uncinatum TaxID=74035 RepID=UPI00144A6E6E|nr:peptidase family M20/M25/M40 protein [Arthroderma uncinatum]KAF3480501.1 peptidase family M20/M25/M40 protein [Arthroderma uncinatum]
MNAEPPSTVGSRRGVRLTPIQTTNRNSTVRVKPPLPEELDGDTSGNRVPLRPKPHGFTLRRWFARAKPSRQSTSSRDSPTPATESPTIFGITSPISRITPSPVPSVNATPISVKSPIQIPAANFENQSNAEDTGPMSTWDPPPLFMVYPQAVKHATLPYPTMSTEDILRRKARRDLKARNDKDKATDADTRPDGPGPKGVTKTKSWKKGKKSHTRSQSSQSSGMKWTQKIFILVTGGYLLQYSVDGNFDRLPEAVLALGGDSVAFACDAIPGKHWVLQISQTQDDIEPSVEPKKTILGRFRRNNTEPQKPASSFLLVLDSAEELASWLMFVRREIQGLGGKDYSTETPGFHRLQPPQMTHQSHEGIRNSLVDQALSSPSSARNSQISVPGPRTDDMTKRENQKPVHQSIEIPSPSSLASTPELDNLRRESRLSYVSIGTRTMPSSQSSSSSVTTRTPASRSPCLESPKAGRVASTDLGIRSRSFVRPSVKPEEVINETPSPPPRSEHRVTSPTPNFSHPILNKRNSVASSPKTTSFPVDNGICQSPVLQTIPATEINGSPKVDEGVNSNQSPPPRRRETSITGTRTLYTSPTPPFVHPRAYSSNTKVFVLR